MKTEGAWIQYQVVWLSAAVSIAIPGLIWFFKLLLHRDKPSVAARHPKIPTGSIGRINSRYLSQAICVTGLSLMVLVFFPVVLALGQSPSASPPSFFAALTVFLGAFFLGVLVLFLKRKGNLDWETDEDITDHES